MSVTPGTRLGVFEVSMLLGVGGMGEVYRARDTKLGRDIAIKILPAEFAHDRDRLARFQREARLLAALNHPNIAHIHDLQESDGVQFLVMELVSGTTLSDRLKEGPLPLAEALTLFSQIAEGLDAAHQQGVIHRDLKPANIKIADDGKVSLLDFGLAKATEPASSTDHDAATSPWNAQSDGKSHEGQILGTPAYMSPEQARGKTVDKRTDIWAFGCCLYEALAGMRPFQGETGSDTLAAILKAEPDWGKLPQTTPQQLQWLLKTCLAKDSRDRLRDIGDARLELREIANNPHATASASVPAGSLEIRHSRLLAAILGVAAISLATGALVWRVVSPAIDTNQLASTAQDVVRFKIDLPKDTAISVDPTRRVIYSPRFALSPDGSQLIYVGGKAGETRLYLRRMGQLEPHPLPGTEGADSPFFSPDGAAIGFSAKGKLKTIRVGAEQPIVICEISTLAGASWGADGMIYFAESSTNSQANNGGLKRVRANGGAPEWITRNEGDPNVFGHVSPCVVVGRNLVLFTLWSGLAEKVSVAALNLDTRKWEIVVTRASYPRYARSGHLMFYDYEQDTFCVSRFDLDRLEIVGPRIPILRSQLLPAVSNNGELVHGPPSSAATRDGARNARPLIWVDRRGKTIERLNIPAQPFTDLRLSPDGKRVVVEIWGERGNSILVYDLAREGPPIHLTSAGNNSLPVWTADSKRVIFNSWHDSEYSLKLALADGSVPLQALTHVNHGQFAFSISPEDIVAYVQVGASGDFDIHTLALKGGDESPLLRTPRNESFPAFSPDGRWLAYAAEENGRREIFIQPYPTGTPRRISELGGNKPLWSSKGDELFYRNGSQLFCVSVVTEPALSPGQPQALFDRLFADPGNRFGYGVSPDGERFLFMELTESEAAQGPIDQLFVVQNWFEELKRLVPDEVTAEKPAR